MADARIVTVLDDKNQRVRAAVLTDAVREAQRRHRLGTLASHALGRALICAALFPLEAGKVIKASLQFTGSGPSGTIYAEVCHPGAVRGYATAPSAKPLGNLAYARKGAGLGLLPSGTLSIVRQGPTGSYSVGQVELKNGEIDEDLEHYFESSEQIPTRVVAHVALDDDGAVRSASGFFVQALPDARGHRAPLTRALPDPAALEDRSPEAIVKLLDQDAPEPLERVPLSFTCACSRERALGGLALLDERELVDMIETDRGASITCQFCTDTYAFDEDELRAALAQKRAQDAAG